MRARSEREKRDAPNEQVGAMTNPQLTRAELVRRRRLARDFERYGPAAAGRAIELQARRSMRPRPRAPHGSGRAAR